MKKLVVALLSFTLLFCSTAIVGCSSYGSGSGSGGSSYSHTPNDGHIHRYYHNVKTDKYICELCGYVFKGDPSTLRPY